MPARTPSKVRLFAGLALPADVTHKLVEVQNELSTLGAELRLTPEKNFHITLKFLGEVGRDGLDVATHRLETIAQETPVFATALQGLGTFPRTGPVEVIWAGFGEGRSELKALMRATSESLKDLQPHDASKSRLPHVTLARVKSGGGATLRQYVETNEELPLGSMHVEALHIYQSQLTQEGAKYRVLRSFALAE